MAAKCLLDYAAHQTGTHFISGECIAYVEPGSDDCVLAAVSSVSFRTPLVNIGPSRFLFFPNLPRFTVKIHPRAHR